MLATQYRATVGQKQMQKQGGQQQLQYDAYTGVISAERHTAITKKARKANPIERFNNTLWQRISRLGRAPLSFFKKLAHHSGAIKYFMYAYNLTRVTTAAYLCSTTNQALHSCRLRIEHVHSSVKRYRIVKDRSRLWKVGACDLVMKLCCALHNFRVRLTP
jgi:hypothetical protein